MTRIAIELNVVGLPDEAAMIVAEAMATHLIKRYADQMAPHPKARVCIVKSFREQMAAKYLDYLNNYLSFETWAEHNGLSSVEGAQFLLAMKSCHEASDPEL